MRIAEALTTRKQRDVTFRRSTLPHGLAESIVSSIENFWSRHSCKEAIARLVNRISLSNRHHQWLFCYVGGRMRLAEVVVCARDHIEAQNRGTFKHQTLKKVELTTTSGFMGRYHR